MAEFEEDVHINVGEMLDENRRLTAELAKANSKKTYWRLRYENGGPEGDKAKLNDLLDAEKARNDRLTAENDRLTKELDEAQSRNNLLEECRKLTPVIDDWKLESWPRLEFDADDNAYFELGELFHDKATHIAVPVAAIDAGKVE